MSWRFFKIRLKTKILRFVSRLINKPIFTAKQSQSQIVKTKEGNIITKNYLCPSCKEGFLEWQQFSEMNNLFQVVYLHTCSFCGTQMNLQLAYPHREKVAK